MKEWNLEEAIKIALDTPVTTKHYSPRAKKTSYEKAHELINATGTRLKTRQIANALGHSTNGIAAMMARGIAKGLIILPLKGWYSTPQVEAKLKEQANDSK